MFTADARSASRVAAHLDGFLRSLGEAGVRVTASKRLDFLHAVTALPPESIGDLYWTARVSLLTRVEDVEAFDPVFDAWFRRASTLHREPRPHLPGRGEARAPLSAAEVAVPADERRGLTGAQTSTAEIVSRKAFPLTRADARAVLGQVQRSLPSAVPSARAPRTQRARAGPRFDLERVGREANRTAGEIIHLYWRRRRRRTRPVLLLIDVSGSVKQHSPDMLRFAHAAVAAVPRVEVFTFGTRLTRVTGQLRTPDTDHALAALGRAVLDADAGTRIGTAFEALLDNARYQSLIRGALVVVLSDGLERGDCDAMIRATRRLGMLAHRLVWWSPLACSPAYRPVTRGMRGVLASVDELAGVRDLESVLKAVRRLPELTAAPRRGAARTWSEAL